MNAQITQENQLVGALNAKSSLVGAMTMKTGSGGTDNHAALINRDKADQHPMGAITGLVQALAEKLPASQLQESIDQALEQAKESGEFDGAGMDITGATVGQIAKITEVDENGKPTAWEPVDMPSGGGETPYTLVKEVTTTEDNVLSILVDGFSLDDMYAMVEMPKTSNTAQYASVSVACFPSHTGNVLRINNYGILTSLHRWISVLVEKQVGDSYLVYGACAESEKPFNVTTVTGSQGSNSQPIMMKTSKKLNRIAFASESTTVGFPLGTTVKIYGR